MMRIATVMLGLVALWITPAYSGIQMAATAWSTPSGADPPELPGPPTPGGKKEDAAYKLYKQGYNLVLDERWEDARRKLAEVAKEYPKSVYVDDAEYWSAYALMHLDRRKAIAAYQKFIDRRPSSKYYNDAVADLTDLGTVGVPVPVPMAYPGKPATVISTGGGHLYMFDSGRGFVTSSESAVVHSLNRQLHGMGVYGYSYSTGRGAAERTLSRALAIQGKTLRAIRLPSSSGAPRATLAPSFWSSDEDLDEETKIKLEALEELGSENEDSASFRALREIVLDRGKKNRLRMAAMEKLVDFKKFDPLPVFLEVAKSDTGMEVQNSAIDYIGMLTKDKNRSVETLIELFYAIPGNRSDQRENIFYSIAEVGNDRAVDFLAKIAQTDEKYDLRREAVYYLGSIGSPRARSALVEILREK